MRKWLFFLVFTSALSLLKAQPAKLTLDADTSQLSIGEQVVLTVNAQFEGQAQLPFLPDTISGLTLVKTSAVDTLNTKQGLQLQQRFTITSFDSGFVVIPALSLMQNGKAIAQSQRLILEVFMPDVKEGPELYDIKKPLAVEKSLWDTLKWVLLALGIVGLALAVFFYLRKQKKPESAIALRRQISPHETALQDLKELAAQELWQKGGIKLYYSELVDILRHYLEAAYALKAMESTAAELAQKMDRLPISESLKGQLKDFLHTSALVKFAKEKPLAATHEQALQSVRNLVHETLKQEEAHV